MRYETRDLKKDYLERIKAHRDSLENVNTIEELKLLQGKIKELRSLLAELDKDDQPRRR